MATTVPPNPNAARRNARVGPVQLPKGGRKGAVPKWPLYDPPTEEERKAWRDLWRTPQAVVWERQEWTRFVARYCRVMIEAEKRGAKTQVRAEARQMEDKLGLTPKAMKLMMWEVVEDEVAAQRQTSNAASARSRVKAVG
jgi:hypothetical protein